MLDAKSLYSLTQLATFRVSRRRREKYSGHASLCVSLSVTHRILALLHRPGCNLGGMVGVPSSCAL